MSRHRSGLSQLSLTMSEGWVNTHCDTCDWVYSGPDDRTKVDAMGAHSRETGHHRFTSHPGIGWVMW